MQIIADLHFHSNFSDGRSTPHKLAHFLKLSGIQYGALTDHDTVAGTDDFNAAAINEGITSISGVEISCLENGHQIHVLGYNFDHKSTLLNEKLNQVLTQRKSRITSILSNLIDLGLNFSISKFFKNYPGPYWGRPQVAEFLVHNKLVASFNDAFDVYLADGKPAYLPNTGFSISEVIDMIHKAGGLAILAHPGLYLKYFPFRHWENYHFDGVELIHPWHKSEKMVIEIRRLATRKNWLVTGGSDFHGRSFEYYRKNGITELDIKKMIEKMEII